MFIFNFSNLIVPNQPKPLNFTLKRSLLISGWMELTLYEVFT